MIDCNLGRMERLLGEREFGEADSLRRKKGERESSSDTGEEREGTTGCSAPARRGVKEGREG